MEIEKRLSKLKHLGAGDAMCADCLRMNIGSLAVCKKCIADTPAFTKLMNQLCKAEVEAWLAEVYSARLKAANSRISEPCKVGAENGISTK